MRRQFEYEADPFELDPEFSQEWELFEPESDQFEGGFGEFETVSSKSVSTTTCPSYQTGEVEKSKTQAGHLPADVIKHSRGLLIADFGVDWRTPKSSVKNDSVLKQWLTTIMQVIQADPTTRIRILGFSDCLGNERNYLLRLGRARKMHQLLYQLLGGSPQWSALNARITFIGAAPTGDYVADNGSVQGRAQNRSVLIESTTKVPVKTPNVSPPPRPVRQLCQVPSGIQGLIRVIRAAVQGLLGPYRLVLGWAGVKLPTTARCLNAAEQAEARIVFKASLDFSRILIADGIGFQGRPFTVAVPIAGVFYVVMLVGNRPARSTLIHELAHAWQSQHAGDPTAFMKNSVRCQAEALKLKAALVARSPLSVFSPEDVSAYAYVPGKSFGEYAAEQIAQQVEDSYRRVGRPTPGILTVIQSARANARDPDNEASLSVISFHLESTPGVVFH